MSQKRRLFMILYHGTNMNFESVELSKCQPNKDFGRGFYVTPIQKQAQLRAVDKCEKEGYGTPTVISYEFDEERLKELSVKIFQKTDEAWAKFVLANRNKRNMIIHDFDIVIGPVADDGVIASISLYESHVIDMQTLIQRLKYVKPNVQYCFGTERSIKLLKKL